MSTAKQGDRGFIAWRLRSDSERLVEDISRVVHYYRDHGYPAPTVRDVYYDLLGWYGEAHGYTKGEKLKQSVYRLLSKMRRAGMVLFHEINDDSSDSLVARTFADPFDFWRGVEGRARSYRKDLIANQPSRVLNFTEGAGAGRQFYEVAKDYTIPVYSGGGWDSINFKHNTADEAVAEYLDTGRQTVVLHAGDFDPDGMDLFRIFTEDVHAFVEGLDEDPGEVIAFKRVMLLPEQIAENKKTVFGRAQLKNKNYRGQRWPYDFKAELQALSLPDRLEIMREAIDREVDHDQLELDRSEGREEHRRVNATAQKLSEDGAT
jgi:hypothetical protein